MKTKPIPFLRGDLREAIIARDAHEAKLRAEGRLAALLEMDNLVDAEVAWQDRARIKSLIAVLALGGES
jgi:hypothetical protein